MHALALSALAATSTGTVVAMAVGGTVFVLGISAVFYAIGRGEDREREQAAREASRAAADAAEPEPAEQPEAPRPRLPASARGRRRR